VKKGGRRNYTKIPPFGESIKKIIHGIWAILEDQGSYNILTITRTPCAR